MPSKQDDALIREHADNGRQHKRQENRKKAREPIPLDTTRKLSKRRKRSRAMYHEAMRFAEQLGIEVAPSLPLTDLIAKVFRRTHALWQHAANEVDMLDPDAKPNTKNSIWTYKWDSEGNRLVQPSKWVLYERELRQELFAQIAMAQKLNLDEAAVRVEAAKLQLLEQALRTAVKKANVPEEMQRRIGACLRTELQTIEGTETAQYVPSSELQTDETDEDAAAA